MADGRKRPRGRIYTDAEKARAIDAFVNGGLSLEEAAATIGASKWSVRSWVKATGVDPGDVARNRDTSKTQTEAATAARLAKSRAAREQLLTTLRERITLPAALLIAERLERAQADEALIVAARDRWRDALLVEAQAADFGPEAVKAAKQATGKAKIDVMIAEAGAPDVNELSMILNRSVRDLLAIEGFDHDLAEEDEDGRLTVVITAPRPDRTPLRIVQLTDDHREAV